MIFAHSYQERRRMSRRSVVDKYPDFFDCVAFQSSAGEPIDTNVSVPILRTPVSGGKAWVVEILWTELYYTWLASMGTTVTNTIIVAWDTVPHVHADIYANFIDQGFMGSFKVSWPANPATPISYAKHNVPHIQNFTEQQGHGVLVATDKIYVAARTDGLQNPGGFRLRFYFRHAQVGMNEFIGIVQSQGMRNA